MYIRARQSLTEATDGMVNGVRLVSSVTATDLGGTGGKTWPPALSASYEESFFGGWLSVQLLFPCGGQSVLLEVTATLD